MNYGPECLIEELRRLGNTAELVTANDGNQFAVISSYEIKSGRFIGRKIDLGLHAQPDFPKSVGSSIHIRCNPQLYDYSDTIPDVRNIQKSALGDEWRYWSINFNWKGDTARRLMSQINGVFQRA